MTPDGTWEQTVMTSIALKSRQWGLSSYELGIEFWHWNFTPGVVIKIISYADPTAVKMKRIIDQFYKSAADYFEHELGADPYKYLAFAALPGNQHEMICEKTGSIMEFTSQGSKGSGRSLTVNRIYATEFSEWDNVADVWAGFGGSMVKDGSAAITVDFTGRGTGNHAHREWKLAMAGESVFTPFFYGTDDFDYDPGHLEFQRKLLKGRFIQEFPRTWDQAFLASNTAIFDSGEIQRSARDEYAVDLPDNAIPDFWNLRPISYGVDPAEGTENGSWTVISSMDAETGREAFPPIRKKWGPRQTAAAIRRQHDIRPGVWVIERNNHGHAVILQLQNFGLDPWLYYGKDGKPGWNENRTNKTILETDMTIALDEQTIEIVSENARDELTAYCQRPDGSTGHPKTKGNSEDDPHDDEAIANMLKLQGRVMAIRRVRAARGGEQTATAGTTMDHEFELGDCPDEY
jgi:hypothetical protein